MPFSWKYNYCTCSEHIIQSDSHKNLANNYNTTPITATYPLDCQSSTKISSENMSITDNVARTVDPNSVSTHSDEARGLPTATAELQSTTSTSTTAGSYYPILKMSLLIYIVPLGKRMHDNADEASKKSK